MNFIYRVELEKYLTEISNDFDVCIRCVSKEQRSLRSLEIIKKHGTKIKHMIDVKLRDLEDIESIVESTGISVSCSFHDSIAGVREIIDSCKIYTKNNHNASILIDITAFIKPYFFRILKSLITIEKFPNVSITYTEPLAYKKDPEKEHYEFTKGTKQIAEIPGFGYHEDQEKKRLLAVNLGFERGRAYEVYKNLEPDKTIAINGFPSYLLEYKNISILCNQELLIEANCLDNLKMASANDPLETILVLNEIYKDWNDSHNITVSPLGTKPMALGTLLFALNHNDVRVVFPYPTEYYEQQPSEEFGNTWLYKIT